MRVSIGPWCPRARPTPTWTRTQAVATTTSSRCVAMRSAATRRSASVRSRSRSNARSRWCMTSSNETSSRIARGKVSRKYVLRRTSDASRPNGARRWMPGLSVCVVSCIRLPPPAEMDRCSIRSASTPWNPFHIPSGRDERRSPTTSYGLRDGRQSCEGSRPTIERLPRSSGRRSVRAGNVVASPEAPGRSRSAAIDAGSEPPSASTFPLGATIMEPPSNARDGSDPVRLAATTTRWFSINPADQHRRQWACRDAGQFAENARTSAPATVASRWSSGT